MKSIWCAARRPAGRRRLCAGRGRGPRSRRRRGAGPQPDDERRSGDPATALERSAPRRRDRRRRGRPHREEQQPGVQGRRPRQQPVRLSRGVRLRRQGPRAAAARRRRADQRLHVGARRHRLHRLRRPPAHRPAEGRRAGVRLHRRRRGRLDRRADRQAQGLLRGRLDRLGREGALAARRGEDRRGVQLQDRAHPAAAQGGHPEGHRRLLRQRRRRTSGRGAGRHEPAGARRRLRHDQRLQRGRQRAPTCATWPTSSTAASPCAASPAPTSWTCASSSSRHGRLAARRPHQAPRDHLRRHRERRSRDDRPDGARTSARCW